MNIVKPPFIVYEHGDIIFFDTLEAMGGYVEAIDVINNEYEFFDATGNEIIAKPIKNSDMKANHQGQKGGDCSQTCNLAQWGIEVHDWWK
jgi:hypothetical protein